MALFDFKCEACGFTDEYIVYSGLKDAVAPIGCPKCKGLMTKQFGVNGFNFDLIGWSPDNEHGKKNWKKRLSPDDQAKVLTPDHNGKYKDPW